MPACIMHRLDEESKHEWYELMLDVEDAFTVLATVASTVVEKSAVAECDKLKKQTCWLATVEIDVMTCIFAAPKLTDEAQHEKQKVQMSEKIAEGIARQLLEFVKVGPEELTRHTIPPLRGTREVLLASIMLLVRNDAWPIPPAQSAGAEEILAPTVVRLYAHGMAVSQHTTVQKKQVAIDALPWAKWVELETPCPDQKLAKLLLETVVRQFHRHLMADPSVLPIALIREGKDIQMQATKKIDVGACVVPIFSGRHTPW